MVVRGTDVSGETPPVAARVPKSELSDHPRVRPRVRMLVPAPAGGVVVGVQAIGRDDGPMAWGNDDNVWSWVASSLDLLAFDRDLGSRWHLQEPAAQVANNPCDLGFTSRVVPDGLVLAYRGGGDVQDGKFLAVRAADEVWQSARPVLAHLSWSGDRTAGRLGEPGLPWPKRCLALDAVTPFGSEGWFVPAWNPFGRALHAGRGYIAPSAR